MKRASLFVGTAAAVMFLMAGCTITDLFLFTRTDPATGDRVVVGSVDAVALTTQKSLQRLGMQAVVTTVGQEVHISSQTRNGSRFEFILTREQSGQGERTHIRMHWWDNRDDQASVQILAEVDKEHKKQ
jgi:hypothetical protein